MIVMTLLVRDEQDIVAANLDYHLSQGVDHFIVTDHRSEEATAAILKDYVDRGLVHYIHESGEGYDQHVWVTRMARMAFTEHGADWVINSDADEFWWPTEGTLATTFACLPPSVTVVLHEVIQAAMPFEDYHLFEFEINDTRYGIPHPEWEQMRQMSDASKG